MSAAEIYVHAGTLRATGIAMLVIGTFFMAARCFARWYRTWRFQIEDVFMLLAYGFFLSMTISYIAIIPPLYRVTEFAEGLIPPYPAVLSDSLAIIKVFFANSMLLWFTLWSVKFSVMFLYRRLMVGLPKYLRWWWAVFGFCVVTLIGAVVSNFTSCSSMHAWFTPGLCTTHRDVVAQIASLYYAFATDVISDIMIMILPIRLIWNLQIPRAQKFSIGGIFGVGVICIVAAIVRVVQIGVKARSDSTPSSSWLALWAMIEAAIAIVIGSLPSFAVVYRHAKNTRRGYTPNYYENRGDTTTARSGQKKTANTSVLLSNITNTTRNHRDGVMTSSSQEGLAKPGQIAVTRSVQIDYEA